MIYHEVIVTDDFFMVPLPLSFVLARLVKGTKGTDFRWSDSSSF